MRREQQVGKGPVRVGEETSYRECNLSPFCRIANYFPLFFVVVILLIDFVEVDGVILKYILTILVFKCVCV